jgi:NTE family protein
MIGLREPGFLPRPIAFVFGGGGGSTASQVGMLAAVLDTGLRPDLIVGTSAGALNGVLLADDPACGLQRLTELWTNARRSHLIADGRVRQFRNMLGGHFMFGNHRLRQLLAEQLVARTFPELRVRFACVATDLDSGDTVVLQQGELLDALLATCAIPGVFPLVRRNGQLLVDGGYVANVPVREALDLGAASMVVFDGRPRVRSRGEPRDVRASMGSAFAAALRRQFRDDLDHVRERVPVLVMPGQPTSYAKAFDLAACARLIDDARLMATEHLALLGGVVPDLAE